jgi:hypothetical protein
MAHILREGQYRSSSGIRHCPRGILSLKPLLFVGKTLISMKRVSVSLLILLWPVSGCPLRSIA